MLILLREGLQISGSLCIFEAVCFGKDEEGVNFIEVTVVPEHHLKQYPLGSDDAVQRNMVAHSPYLMRGKT